MMMQYRNSVNTYAASANFAEASSVCTCAAMPSSNVNVIMLIMGAIMMASIIICSSIIIAGMIALLVLGLVGIIVLLAHREQLNQPKGWA